MLTLGWLGNILILAAIICLGRKWIIGWLFSILGNMIWCIYALQLEMPDMLVIDGISLVMAAYNWRLWAREKKENNAKAPQ